MNRAGLILTAFLMTGWAAPVAAETLPYLVADLNREAVVSGSAFPPAHDFFGAQMVELGGVLYFTAEDPMHGRELWRSDGTPGGTRLVRDIHPGPGGSLLRSLTVHRGRLYFFAEDGVWGLEVWSSDGTREGTRLLRDVCPGPCSSAYFSVTSIVSAGDLLYFAAGSLFDLDLWRTDGTREGTRRIVDACSGCLTLLDNGLVALSNGRVLFSRHHPQNGNEIWVSDGTPEGTTALDLAPGFQSSGPSHLISLGDRALFWAYDGIFTSLWVSDGTRDGTHTIRSHFQRPGFDSGPVAWNGAAWFANEAGELWRSDGTFPGTILLQIFDNGFTPYPTPYRPTRLTPMPAGLLFIAGDPTRGMGLWRTRGTWETTQLLKDPAPGPESPDLAGLHRAGDRAFFVARTAAGPIDLWSSDGKVGGTRQVATLCQDLDGCFSADRHDFQGAGGLSFFIAHSPLVGRELWRSDGSAAGTFLVRDIHSDPGSAGVDDIAALNGRALFGARTASSDGGRPSLWSSDGTPAGTVPVHDDALAPKDFLSMGGQLYFSGGAPWYPGSPQLRRRGLWRTDGTPAGTELLEDALFDLDLLALDGGTLFLSAWDHEGGYAGTGVELWKSDGTPDGTRQVIDLDQQWVEGGGSPPLPTPGSSDPGPPVRLGPVLLFAADDGLSGRELWATNGTAPGTFRVRDINRQDIDEWGYIVPGESYPDNLVRLGGVVLFAADDGLSGRELWVTDGTEAGTRLLRDLRPGTEGSSPHDLVEYGGRVYFFAAHGPGEALWRTDGTAGGTVRIKSLSRQGLPSWGRDLTAAGGRLFFVADNEAIGPELHVSDGTPSGTRLVRQIRPGPNGSYPQSLTAVDGVLVFAADDGEHGLEPWRSDGSAAGTYPLGDVAPGPAASSPASFTDAGSILFFAADDGSHGRELWGVSQ